MQHILKYTNLYLLFLLYVCTYTGRYNNNNNKILNNMRLKIITI